MKKRQYISLLLAFVLAVSCLPGASAAGNGMNAPLLMALATRSGPGTRYDEPGSFFQGNYQSASVRVLTRAWDSRNEIWWLQVEFYEGGTPYRVYTGLKRVNIDIGRVPDERVLGSAVTLCAASGFWGPGTQYAKAPYTVPANTAVTVLDVESGYAQIEFSPNSTQAVGQTLRRAWVRTDCVSGSWGGYDTGSGTSASLQPAGGSAWRSAYRDFIASGEYGRYLRPVNANHADSFYDRDTSRDAYATYDLDRNGIPELLIGTEYIVDQVDVFACQNGSVSWLGTMCGNNFIDRVFCYDRCGYPGRVYTVTGGPARKITEYTLTGSGLSERIIGVTCVDRDGLETNDISMYVNEASLESLLTVTLFHRPDQSQTLIWTKRSALGAETVWDALLNGYSDY